MLRWREEFWQSVLALNVFEFVSFLAIEPPYLHLDPSQTSFYIGVIRNWLLHCDYPSIFWSDVSIVTVHPILLSIADSFEPGPPKYLALAVAGGHISIITWMAARYNGRWREAVFFDSLIKGQRSIAEFMAPRISLCRADRRFSAVLQCDDERFVSWVLDQFRPELSCADIASAVKSSKLSTIQHLSKQYAHLFGQDTILAAAARPRIEVFEWLHKQHPSARHRTGTLETAIQAITSNIAAVEWLVTNGYTLSQPRTPLRFTSLAVLHFMSARDEQLQVSNSSLNLLSEVPLTPHVRWIRDRPELVIASQNLLETAFGSCDMAMLQAIKDGGYDLRGRTRLFRPSHDYDRPWSSDDIAMFDFYIREEVHLPDLADYMYNMSHVQPERTLSLMQWVYDHLNQPPTAMHLRQAIRNSNLAVVQWMYPLLNERHERVWSWLPHCWQVFEWLLEKEEDDSQLDAQAVAVGLHVASARGLQMIHRRNPTVIDPRSILRSASVAQTENNLSPRRQLHVVRWVLETFPTVAFEPMNGYLTIDDLQDAHCASGTNSVALYLERKCKPLFPAQSATRQDAERTRAAEREVARYQSQQAS